MSVSLEYSIPILKFRFISYNIVRQIRNALSYLAVANFSCYIRHADLLHDYYEDTMSNQ